MAEHPVLARLRDCLGQISSYRTRYLELKDEVEPLKARIQQLEDAFAASQQAVALLQEHLRGVEGVTSDIEGALASWESSAG